MAVAFSCRAFASRAPSALATPARAAAASKVAAAVLNAGSVTPPLSSYDEFAADVADDGARGLSRVLGTDAAVDGHGQLSKSRAPLHLFPVSRAPLSFKSIRIALVGAPNAGKSTLMNALCGTKVSAVSPKFNTTRDQVLGYMHIFDDGPAGKGREVTELVFVDTPGLLPASANTGAGGSKRYVKTLVTAATEALATVDVVLLVVDAARRWDEEQAATLKTVAEACAAHGTRLCLVANKVDLVRHNQRESEARLKLLERRRNKAAAAAGGGAVVAVDAKAKAPKKGGSKKDGAVDLAAAAAVADAAAASNGDAAASGSSTAPGKSAAAAPASGGAAVLSGDAWARMVAQSKAAAGVPAADAEDESGARGDAGASSSESSADAGLTAPEPAAAAIAGAAPASAAAAAKARDSGSSSSDSRSSSGSDAPFVVRTAGEIVESLARAFEAACEAASLPTAIARRRAAKAAAAAAMRSIAREAGTDVEAPPGAGAGRSSRPSVSARSSPAAATADGAGAAADADAAADAEDEDELLPSVYSISARSAEGVDELREALLRCSRPVPRLSFEPPPPPRSGAGAGNALALMQNTSTSIRLGSPTAPGSSSGARAASKAASAASSGSAGSAGGGSGSGGGVREVKATVGTDMSPQERVAEIIREKLFLNLHDEVPYGIAQRTRRWRFYDRRQSADGVETLVVDQELLVPRDSVAAILRARQAGPLKAIGIAAMKDIEAVLGVRVRLFLHAVVDPKLARVGAADAGGSGTAPRMM